MGLGSLPLVLLLRFMCQTRSLLDFLQGGRVALLSLSGPPPPHPRAAGPCMQACQRPWVLRPLTLCFSQITSATTAPALITGAWPAPPSQATSVSLGLCSTPTVITCPARNFRSWEEAMPTAGTPGARWKARGALRRIKTYAWNCVPYPRVVCILSLSFFFFKMLTVVRVLGIVKGQWGPSCPFLPSLSFVLKKVEIRCFRI